MLIRVNYYIVSINIKSCLDLVNNNAPLVRLLAVHDAAEPALKHLGVVAALTVTGRNLDVLVLVVDKTDGSDEEGSARGESLEESALLVRLDDISHGELALDDLDTLQRAGGLALGEARAGELENGSAGNALQDDALAEGRGDKLDLLGLLVSPDDEEVGRTRLGDVSVLAEEPQNLIETTGTGLALSNERRTIVGTKLGVAESTRPSTNSILSRSKKLKSRSALLLRCVALERRRRSRSSERLAHIWEQRNDNVQQSLLRALHAERRIGRNHRRADVQEAALAVAGQPLGAVARAERDDHLLQLLGVEVGEGDSLAGAAHALAVLVDAEEAQLVVVAAVEFEAFEALGGVVQDGGGGHDGEGTVGLEFGGGPAGFLVPGGGDHVVGAGFLGHDFGAVHGGDFTGRGVEGYDHFGSVQRGEVVAIVDVVLDASLCESRSLSGDGSGCARGLGGDGDGGHGV